MQEYYWRQQDAGYKHYEALSRAAAYEAETEGASMPRRNRWPESPSQKRKKRNHKRKPARERNMRLQQNARITGKRQSTTTHFG